MATKSPVLSKEDVKDVVSQYLAPHQPSGYQLRITGVKQDGDYYYVVVQPSRDDIRSYDYYNLLAETENDIEEKENLNIMLVPALPGD